VVRSLRARGTPLVLLSARRLEPALFARGVQRQRMPPLGTHPERWQATLLELAARLEPRPLLFGCSAPALEFLRRTEACLLPHYALAPLRALDMPGVAHGPQAAEIALRRAVTRGEAALEVQMVRDGRGRRTGHCTLLWAPGAAPDLVVSSVAGSEVATRTETLLQRSGHLGYARTIWAPDRFGRLELQASSPLPGPGVMLAHEDGVDFPALAYAATAGGALAPQRPRQGLVRKLPLQEPGLAGEASPLVVLAPRPMGRDPLPWAAALLRSLVRS
jgi:hypothetical protein